MNTAEEILKRIFTPGHAVWGETLLTIDFRRREIEDCDGNSIEITREECDYLKTLTTQGKEPNP